MLLSHTEVIKELLAKGAVVESLDLKEAPDILAQARNTQSRIYFFLHFSTAHVLMYHVLDNTISSHLKDMLLQVLSDDELQRFSTKQVDVADTAKADCLDVSSFKQISM